MYLGIDLGTSGAKCVLVDDQQQVIASATGPLSVQRPHSGWSEQDPNSWINATCAAMDQLRQDHSDALAAVRAIGLSGQMHGATLIDSADKPLRPCLLWNDTRSHEQAAMLDRDPQFRDKTGNIVFPGFTAPKVAWVRDNEPALFGKIAKVLLPKDFLRLWLTGEHISDMSDSAGTSWLDVKNRRWDEALLEATDLGLDHMPSLVEGSAPAGRLRSEAANALGLTQGIVVAGGAGDNAASAIGMGTIDAGQAFVSLGTSGVLFAANASYLPNPQSAVHTFCHALPDTWHQMGVILSATDSLNWLANLTGTDAADLTNQLGAAPSGPTDVRFLPYLSGERTPHNDATIRGQLIGFGHDSDRTAIAQAVLEGVAFALCDCMAALREAGTTLSRVTAVGGGSRSNFWLATIANTLNIDVDIPADGDFGGAFGAARLAILADTGATPGAVCAAPITQRTISPDRTLTNAYHDAWQHYRQLYRILKGVSA